VSDEPHQCRMCRDRGKTWDGADPTCGFNADGSWNPDNWNCATMNELRNAVAVDAEWNDDQYCGRLALREGDDRLPCGAFLILGWYKSRGRTEYAGILCGYEIDPLTEDEAVAILSHTPEPKETTNG